MKLTKSQREIVKSRFGGKCAYCGCDLPTKWHADHLEPVIRMNWAGKDAERPQNHNIGNMMPACAQCNISKASMPLEAWRVWLAGHLKSLNQYHAIYRLAKAYGLVEETGADIVFYFERRGEQQ